MVCPSQAAKTVFLVDGMVSLLSHWAFSDIFEEQGFTWDVRLHLASVIIP